MPFKEPVCEIFNLIASPLLKCLRFKICEVDALSALLSSGLELFTIVGFQLLHHISFFADAAMEI
jgi:hypothetical protein